MSAICARLTTQNIFNNHTLFSYSFYKIKKEDQRNDEIDLFTDLNFIQILTESDIDSIDVRSQLELQIQIPATKYSGWILDKKNSMKTGFCETGEINGSSYVKSPSRSNPFLIIEYEDKYRFLWSISASLHPCKSDHPHSVSNYKQYFNILNIEFLDFTNVFRCSDVLKFENLNKLSIRVFELNFCQDKDTWKHKLIPIGISENDTD